MKEPMPMAEERNARSEAHEVAQWLRRHPRFLEQFPDLAVTLVVPKDAGASASLAGYQLEVLREKNRELTRRLHELSGNAQDNERLAVRTHQLTLALMRAGTAADTLRAMVACLSEDFAGDAVRITVLAPVPGLEGASWCQVVPAADPRMAPFREAMASGEPLCGRLAPERQALLFGDDASRVASCAVLPVAGVGLVAVGSVDPNRFFPGMGTLFLRMMAEALATAMGRASPR
jgi:uncharacterized protein YigA (DUF484 family)